MDHWEDPWDDGDSDPGTGAALADVLARRGWRVRWPPAENHLWIASALLLATNLLLILAVFANVAGGLGPLTPRTLLSFALAMDLPGVSLLAWIVWDRAMRTRGRDHWIRRVAALLLVAWVGLSALWRFILPAAIGTNVQDLFTSFLNGTAGLPPEVQGNVPTLYNVFGLWMVAAAAFAAAHVLLAVARRTAPPDDWFRGLPAYIWVVGGGISLLATVFIVLSFLSILAGREPAENFLVWIAAKTIVAPNVLLSGYASSLDLGWRIRSGRLQTPIAWRRRP